MINYRVDGWGSNVFEFGDSWTFVTMCNKCTYSALERNFKTKELAKINMELRISEHKNSDDCGFDWRRERVESNQ